MRHSGRRCCNRGTSAGDAPPVALAGAATNMKATASAAARDMARPIAPGGLRHVAVAGNRAHAEWSVSPTFTAQWHSNGELGGGRASGPAAPSACR